MPSYQSIETRLRVVEEKLDFVMKAITSARREGIIEPKIVVRSLLDMYLASKGAPQAPLAEITAPETEPSPQGDGDPTPLSDVSE